MEELVELLASNDFHNIVVITGAGISVASGIPDFRSPKIGLYASIKQVAALRKYKPTFVFELDVFRNDPRPFWWIFSKMWPATSKALPTPFHFFLTLLHQKGMLLRCYTQNVDGLEKLAGLPDEKIVNAHGVMDACHCLMCGQRYPVSYCMEAMKKNLEDVDNTIETATVPKCKCGSKWVKPDVVFFKEDLPNRFYELSPSDFQQADLLIVAGTSLEVYPCAGLTGKVRKEVKRFLVNKTSLKYTSKFHFKTERDWFIQGDAQDFALTICDKLGWGDELKEMIENRKNIGDHWMSVKSEETDTSTAFV